ncbi:translocation/assembly module TamB domain-containing protein [Candidatus Deferrimicrobium sp.]|uniref:translocation/assembly module TamB domain-containing protein n=1 Tax=Candidatus Deferrimicrobium sp. TaxID=3060586 RepID=UPI002715FB85|nr:translocation/assembly module TamB domain-containing protein [Candidatus Deferrimicrobium sp.]MDO8739117.1 translocation/assembly module TamB domain-containing protein [Candidatus Deferrimicrobium sp.]
MRWVRWTGGGLLVLLLSVVGWRLSLEIPERVRRAGAALVDAAAREGVGVRYGELKLHLLHLHVSIDNVVLRDALADLPLGSAGSVDVSFSPLRFLTGDLPVSRVRVRNFRLEAGERNRALYDRWISTRKEGPRPSLPEILLVDGSILLTLPGPLRRFQAVVREVRIREVRFLGTHITASLERAEGDVVLAGGAGGVWPFPSVEADLFYKEGVLRVRKFKAARDSAALRLSGSLDTRKRIASAKASGELDIAEWIAAGAPGVSHMRRVVREGKAEFSVTADGPWNDPEGAARLVFRNAGFPGAAGAEGEGEVQLTLRGRVLRLARARAKLWGGVLEADGLYRTESGHVEGKASLRRVSLAAVPWKALGIPVSLAGTGDASVRVAGTADRLEGAVSLALPGGLERISSTGGSGPALRFPMSLEAGGSVSGGREVRVDSFRLLAGKAESRGDGEGSISGETLRLRGSLSLPAGKASDYGVGEPLAWEKIVGEWELSGPWSRLRGKVSLSATALAFRTLPPLPVMLKIDGVPSEALHVSADVPAQRFKATAEGTWTFPFDRSRSASEWTVSAREIDLSDSARWVSAVAMSLGADAGGASRYLADIVGKGEADGRIRVAAGKVEATGRFQAARVEVRGVPLRDLRAEGEFGSAGFPDRWGARAEGKFGDGAFHVATNGDGGNMIAIEGKVEGIEIAQAFSLLRRDNPGKVRGTVDAGFAARRGPMGWEVPRFTAGTKELWVGPSQMSGVRAEGRLGAADGTFSFRSVSPPVRIDGEVQRSDGWPAKVSLTASDVPTSFLLVAGGRSGISSGGAWSGEAGGVIRLADIVEGGPLSLGVLAALHGSVRATNLSVGEVRFAECRASGRMRGDVFEGEVLTRAPDSRLAWSVSLREPFAFRLEGPFSLGDPGNGTAKNGNHRFSLRGRAQIEGALRAVEKTSGTVLVESLTYREGGFELSGKDLSARMDPAGVRWTGGTILAEGKPVRISGKVSWGGALDVRVEGKLPASVVRLAVPSVFDRLDGTVTLEARVTGNRDAPFIVGTGHLEGGVVSFIGYNQLFEGIRADAVISREKIVFEHFEGKSGGGYIDGWGEVPLKMDAGQRLYFSVDFLDVRYPYPEDLRPVVQGHAELLGPVNDLLVTGDIEVQSALYTKTLRPEKALVDFRKRLFDVSARREKSAFRVRLDINAIADGTIRIRNNMVDAIAKGEFRIVGDTTRVIVLGSFDVVEGTVEFRGNKYELKRAMVDFQDPRRNNPRLDWLAETKKGNVTVTVAVTGTLDKYEVDLFSDPPLGKNDIVALLSLGVTTQALVGQEGAVGSAAAASIALGPYKGGVEERIRGVVGLDRFAIEPGFSSTTKTFEPKFIVGKSFGDRASVSMATSVGTSADSTATAEYKLRENIFLQGSWQSATTTQEGDLGADLKFRYRYRQWKDFLRGKE